MNTPTIPCCLLFRTITHAFSSSCSCSFSLPPQAVGGQWDILHQFDGSVATDYLGSSVSNAGDVNSDGFADVIVGARGSSPNGIPLAGSAFVYSGVDGSVLHQFDGTGSSDYFGMTVSSAGDVNGDGIPDLLVGAPYASLNGVHSGSVYVFSGLDGLLLYQFDGTTSFERKGDALSGAGDVNGDGFADVIVGVPYADYNNLDSGSAFVYSGADGSVLHQFDGTFGDKLGNAVSDAGDVNSDGIPDLLVGAFDAVPSGSNQRGGSAFVYSGSDGSLLYRLEGTGDNSQFGCAVSGAGDVNGDGLPDFFVGDYGASPNGISNAGSAYVYSGADGLLLNQFDGAAYVDWVGWNISGAGDVNGDGLDDVICSAFNASNTAGAAYVYSFNPIMKATAPTVSSTGGVLDLEMDFPDDAAGDEYKIIFSLAGTGPSNHGVDIPLSMDRFATLSFHGFYPSGMLHSGMMGILDSEGAAIAQVGLHSGPHPWLIGTNVYFAAIANKPNQLPEYSSVAVVIEITP